MAFKTACGKKYMQRCKIEGEREFSSGFKQCLQRCGQPRSELKEKHCIRTPASILQKLSNSAESGRLLRSRRRSIGMNGMRQQKKRAREVAKSATASNVRRYARCSIWTAATSPLSRRWAANNGNLTAPAVAVARSKRRQGRRAP